MGSRGWLDVIADYWVVHEWKTKRDVHSGETDEYEEEENMDYNTSSLLSSVRNNNNNNNNNGASRWRGANASADAPNSAFFLQTAQVQIPLYSIIFLLAVVGNALVILTLVQNKRMRTITNVHLLNLAISDLLLGVFCMPVTLIGTLLKNFIFGEMMCKLIPYLQAVCVAVSAWTLVAISIERHYAICHPFRSRRWQTLSHAHRMIAIIWIGSLLCMAPIASLSVLKPFGNSGRYKCREEWPSDVSEKAYNILLDVILLIIPLLIMVTNYSLITATLWKGIKTDEMIRECDDARENSITDKVPCRFYKYNSDGMRKSISSSEETLAAGSVKSNATSQNAGDTDSQGSARNKTPARMSNYGPYMQVRHSNVEVSLANKKRVIKMLFMVVLEYFVCWTPLYIIHTIAHFDPKLVYHDSGYTAISFSHLIAYASSCCNPITYCFMNSKFRHAFLSAFGCQRKSWMPAGFNAAVSSKSDNFHMSNSNK